MYLLGMFYSQPVHFGHLGPNSTSWEFHCLSLYGLATLGENVPFGSFFLLNQWLWPFSGENVLARGFLILVRYILAV